MNSKRNIIIDIERMKYPNTGLHNFCKNLYQFLLKENTFNYFLFAHKKVSLSATIQRINIKLINKIWLFVPSKYEIWHGTYQSTRYVPFKPIKFILTIHDLNFLYEKISIKKKKRYLKEIQRRIDRAAYITTISKFVLEDIKKHLNVENKKIQVIYNGVDLLRFPEFSTPNYNPEKKYLFTIGTVLHKKNFHELVKLLEDNTEYELLIAGIQPDITYLNRIKNEASKLGVSDRVKFLGAVSEEEKYWYLNNCEAFLFPSLAEGFGIPVIEAMLLGKPVFLSTKTSLPEIGGKYAYYFENFEKDHMNVVLKNGLQDYTSNPKKEKIIEWAEQFSWEKAAKNYNKVYEEVLSK